MPWPIEGDYFEAVQNPSFCFADPDLRQGTLTLNALGLPKPITGAFASVYQISGSRQRWAVRCFLREFADQQQRYAAISSHLRAAKLAMMVSFEFLQKGILVKGQWYPILKMEWIEGEPLDRFVARQVGQPHALQLLARQWIELMGALRKAQVAHGDLQHGNIIVSHGALRLIDYDGMYVPSLCGSLSHEEGHRNYQHPKRTGHDFNLQLDNFSAWVIFHSLSALALEPRLWQLLDGGDEHLLFRREDFEHPSNSKAFQTIERSGKPELQALGAHFRSLLSLPLSQIPALDGTTVQPLSHPPTAVKKEIPDWLSDQVPQPGLQEPVALSNVSGNEPENAVVGAAWLADHLVGGTPLPPVLNTGKFWLERIACGLTVLFVFVVATLLLFNMVSLSLSAAIMVGAPVGLAGLLFLRYRSFNLVSEKRIAVSRCSVALQALHATERAIRGVNEDRKLASKPLTEIDEKYRAIPKFLSAELSSLHYALSNVLSDLSKQLASLDASEDIAIRSVVGLIQNKLNQLIQQRNSIDSAERTEISQCLQQLRRSYIEQTLANTWIANADLIGVGTKLKARLEAHGIISAADVGNNHVQKVEGIGAAKARSLQVWRLQVEQQATLNAPQSLPMQQTSQIRNKFFAKRELLDGEIDMQRNAEARERQTILNRFASTRKDLNRKESDCQARYKRDCEAVHVKWQKEREQLRVEFQRVEFRVEAEKTQFGEQLAELNRQGFRDRLKECEMKRELERYRDVSFIKFLRKSFFLHSAA